MKKIKIVMADQDENYLLPLEKKFVDELKEKADIVSITSRSYFDSFFSEGRILDILIVSEELYSQELQRHEIGVVFVLTEREENNFGNDHAEFTYVEKYTSVKEIFTQVISASNMLIANNSHNESKTEIISVYSPIGGCGRTTVAAGICLHLARYNRKVLYVGIDNLQAFGFLMKQEIYLQPGIEKLFKKESLDEGFRQQIYHDRFDILPPFARQLCSMNITGLDLLRTVQNICKWKVYDYIVVDLPSDISEIITKFMSISAYTLLLMLQDSISNYKMKQLKKNINCTDEEKFIAVCNKYESEKENYIVKNENVTEIDVKKYISIIPDLDQEFIQNLERNEDIHALACMFL